MFSSGTEGACGDMRCVCLQVGRVGYCTDSGAHGLFSSGTEGACGDVQCVLASGAR